MDCDAVCVLGSSYLLLARQPPKSPSPLIRHQAVLLYSPSDTDPSALFALSGPFAQVPETFPYQVVLTGKAPVVVVPVNPGEGRGEMGRKIDLALAGCAANKVRHITFWKPSGSVWEEFVTVGVRHLVETLERAGSKTVHVTLLAPDQPYFSLLHKTLSVQGRLPPTTTSSVHINEESFLRSIFAIYKCPICKRLPNKPIFTGEKILCELCEANIRKRAEPRQPALLSVQAAFESAGFTCRCGDRMTIKSAAEHIFDCVKRDWSCTEHLFFEKSSDEFFDHLMREHFDRVVSNLEKVLP